MTQGLQKKKKEEKSATMLSIEPPIVGPLRIANIALVTAQ